MGCLTGMRETLAPACALSIPAGAIALGPAPQRDQDRPGTKAPGQRPPRPRRALAFRGAGITGLCESRAQGRRKRKSRFRVPPEHATELSLLLWQGLSPLPQRCAGIRTSPGAKAPRPAPVPPPAGAGLPLRGWRRPFCYGSARAGETRCVSRSRANWRKRCLRFNGRGQCPCHSGAPGSGPAGGQSPRPAPAPPPAGASRPPGRALASVSPGPAGLKGTVPRGRGNALRFLFPPELAKGPSPLQWQGPSPLPQRCAGIGTGRGPKAPGQRRPRPQGQSLSPGRKEFPARRADGSFSAPCWCLRRHARRISAPARPARARSGRRRGGCA